MIQLYTGVPGAGKTYRMVHDLDKFIEKNEEINIIANIRELRLPHIDFEEMLLEAFPEKSLTLPAKIERFFEYEYQQSLNQKLGGPILYILDECQLYFPRRASMPQTEAYLQRHRHLGHYLYLATQSKKLINQNIVALIEIEFSAARRSISFFGEMLFRLKSPQSNQIIRTERIRPKKRIFELYKSFESEEIKKPPKQLARRFIPILILLPIAFYIFYQRLLNAEARTERDLGYIPQETASEAQPGNVQAVQASSPSKPEMSFVKSAAPEKLEQKKERVFLMVVEAGNKRLTVDPDTQAVVELSKIKYRVTCVSGGLRCYYDRDPEEAVTVASDRDRGPLPSSSMPFIPPEGRFGYVPGRVPGQSGPPLDTRPWAVEDGTFITEEHFEESSRLGLGDRGGLGSSR